MWAEGLGEGNAQVDQLVTVTVPISDFVKAREAHKTFRQNARGLHNLTLRWRKLGELRGPAPAVAIMGRDWDLE